MERVRAEEHERAEPEFVGSGAVRPVGDWGNAALSGLLARGDGVVPGALFAQAAPNSAVALALQDGPAPVNPSELPAGEYTVIVVGSPGPGEKRVNHAFQFADGAARAVGQHRVWLVERTGYELAEAGLAGVEARAKGARIFWITPDTSLPALLNQFPAKSIVGLHVFSHGVPEQLTLRYGWEDKGAGNYGLSISEARTLTPQAFSPRAEITFDSCNTATGEFLGGDAEGSLASEVADATEQQVTAWIGRTSYREVNKGTGGVVGSEVMNGGIRTLDAVEAVSQLRGRTPRQVTVAPSHASGDWSGDFRMTARLPETRHFPVPEGGTVTATIATSSDYDAMQGAPIRVILHREVNWGPDQDLPGTREAAVARPSQLTWTGLTQGTYYLELFHLSGLEIAGTITVTVR
ncbi:hypothetical protein GCM10009558_069050 [Virgisporangium aurantiacum]